MLMVLTLVFTGCIKEEKEDIVAPSQEVTVNPEYVPIDWETTTVVSSDDNAGTYQIQFRGTVPDIHQGSIIAIDRDTVVLYRFVTSANVSGNTMSVTSTEAYLTDIFANTEFTLSTGDPTKSITQGTVFYPVAAYIVDNNGTYREMGMNRKGETRFTHNLWNFEYNNDGQVLYSGSNYSIYMEKMNLDLSLDMEMYINFGGRDIYEVVDDAIGRYRSRAMKVNAALVGTFNTEQKVRCDVEGNFIYAPDYDLWKHNLFRPIPIKFLAGGVPIVLTLRCDLFRQVEASGSGSISAYTGFTDHAEGRLGFEWQQNGGISPVSSFGNTFNFTPPTLEGKGQVQAKVWAFPRVSVMLYDAVGPSFDFMPYLADTVRGGFREQMLGTGNDYCAWSLDCHAGLDLKAGLSLRFFGYEVENYSTPKWNAIDKRLYHSPKKVVHASGHPAVGETGTVCFNVYDRNFLANADVLTPLPQIVKFEANGQLSSEYGITHDGTVSVNWTPTSSDILYAKLYNQNGNVLSWDTVQVGDSSDSIAFFSVAPGRKVRFMESNLPNGDWSWGGAQYFDWETIGDRLYDGWRLLSADEWNYLLFQRPDAADKIGGGRLNGVPGMILLPDNWVLPPNSGTFTPATSTQLMDDYSDNIVWGAWLEAGAVFLPAYGYYESVPIEYSESGLYWTSSHLPSALGDGFWWLDFGYRTTGADFQGGSSGGATVRLVKTVD